MKSTTLQFSSILELLDFQSVCRITITSYNITHLTLTGRFSEADTELAKAGFGATIVCSEKHGST